MSSNYWNAPVRVSTMKKLHAALKFSAPISSNPRNRTPSSRFFVSSHPSQLLCSRSFDSSSASCGTRSLGSWKLPPLLPSLSRMVEDAHPTGRISLVSCCSCWPTLLSVSTRKGMQGTRSRLSWTLLPPGPRRSAMDLGEKSIPQIWFPGT